MKFTGSVTMKAKVPFLFDIISPLLYNFVEKARIKLRVNDMQYVLYNPLANNKMGLATAKAYLEGKIEGDVEYKDVTKIDDINTFICGLADSDRVILAGGDGTLNRFINAFHTTPSCAIDYIAVGSGNDFKNDIKARGELEGDFIRLNRYMENLPTVTVNGKTYKFINGIGYGIDGYCCEKGDEIRATSDKPVNYTSIAIKGLLFHFKPRNATVTVDGKTTSFKKVWLAPTMKGMFYGGGMMVAPEQDRLADDKKVSVVVWHGTGKLGTLMRFPTVFKGTHVKYTKLISIVKGSEVKISFDRPTALQIDGETVLNVTEYTVKI